MNNLTRIPEEVALIADYLVSGKDVLVVGKMGCGKSILINAVKHELLQRFKPVDVYWRELEHQGESEIIASRGKKIGIFVADYSTVKKANKFLNGDYNCAKEMCEGGTFSTLISTYCPKPAEGEEENNFKNFFFVKSTYEKYLTPEYAKQLKPENTILVVFNSASNSITPFLPSKGVELVNYNLSNLIKIYTYDR